MVESQYLNHWKHLKTLQIMLESWQEMKSLNLFVAIISREQTYATLTVNLSCQFLWFDFCFWKTL